MADTKFWFDLYFFLLIWIQHGIKDWQWKSCPRRPVVGRLRLSFYLFPPTYGSFHAAQGTSSSSSSSSSSPRLNAPRGLRARVAREGIGDTMTTSQPSIHTYTYSEASCLLFFSHLPPSIYLFIYLFAVRHVLRFWISWNGELTLLMCGVSSVRPIITQAAQLWWLCWECGVVILQVLATCRGYRRASVKPHHLLDCLFYFYFLMTFIKSLGYSY